MGSIEQLSANIKAAQLIAVFVGIPFQIKVVAVGFIKNWKIHRGIWDRKPADSILIHLQKRDELIQDVVFPRYLAAGGFLMMINILKVPYTCPAAVGNDHQLIKQISSRTQKYQKTDNKQHRIKLSLFLTFRGQMTVFPCFFPDSLFSISLPPFYIETIRTPSRALAINASTSKASSACLTNFSTGRVRGCLGVKTVQQSSQGEWRYQRFQFFLRWSQFLLYPCQSAAGKPASNMPRRCMQWRGWSGLPPAQGFRRHQGLTVVSLRYPLGNLHHKPPH